MLTRAGSLRCVRRNLIEADDNPPSAIREHGRLGDSLVIGSRSAVRSLLRPGLVCPAQRCAFCSHALPPKPPSANVSVLNCRHQRSPPQSRRPPAHRYPATPRRRHDRLRRTRKPVVHCSVYKDPPLWFLQRLWYLQSARYAQDGAKLSAGRWQNGANRDLHHYRRAKHTPRQGSHSSDGPSLTTSTPLLDGARYWQALGAPSTAAIVTTWSSGPGHWAQRSTIRYAASLTVMGDRFKRVE